MHKSSPLLLAALLLTAAFSAPARAADPPAPSPEQIEAAINKAKTWLYSKQADGNWEVAKTRNLASTGNENGGAQWGGLTAISVYALLAAGENPRDPKLAPAIEFLKSSEIVGTYAVGFRMLAYARMTQTPELKKLAQADLNSILSRIKKDGNASGMYDYIDSKNPRAYSHSRAQYGVLAAWAGTQMGLEVPDGYWKLVQDAWIRNQEPDGGWSYQHPKESKFATTPGMTAAGIASLYLTYDGLGLPVSCSGNLKSPEIDRALAFLAKNEDKFATSTKYDRDFPMPTLYAIERVGLATGLRYIGKSDWYRKGASFLVKSQQPNGSWTGGYGGPVSDTALGILFLARGRTPLVMQKLEYNITTAKKPVEGPWNQRPRDVANITRWIGKQIERELKWQIASLAFPVEDLLDSQILFISGNKPLDFTDEEEKKLRDYVERGGIILGHADCSESAFATSFQKLAAKLFPMYELRELPDDHPIYTRQQFSRKSWTTKPRVLALSNGVRELMILLPSGDPARSWALNANAAGAANFQLMANIFLYANDKSRLRSAGQSYLIPLDPKAPAPTKTVKLARLEYAGNFNPEPAGFPRLANHLANKLSAKLDITSVKLGEGKLNPEFTIAHLTGTSAFSLNEAQRKEIADYLAAGGTLLIDSAGGREAFTTSARAELAAILPGDAQKIAPIPLDHSIYTLNKLPQVEYRNFARTFGLPIDAPRLLGITLAGKTRVIFSIEDLSNALTGTPIDGINGYAPDYALPLIANILLQPAK